jgi:DnaJ family protein C protein 9
VIFNEAKLLPRVGELKAAKAYEKWAKQISKTKPPTSPLRRREK